MNKQKLEELFSKIPSWTEPHERQLLSDLSKAVPENGLIVEIGALYGGVTAVLALSNPAAKVVSIDNFSWTPEGYPKASKKRFLDNMKEVGASNVTVIEATSQEVFLHWDKKIDLLWIDGGHDFKSVFFDLASFSAYADVIALHDYDNEFWPDIRQAIEKFTLGNPKWKMIELVGMVAVLKKE